VRAIPFTGDGPLCYDKTMTTTVAQRRTDYIAHIFNTFIGSEGIDLGQLITTRGFDDLSSMVADLRALGRGKSWLKGIDKWEETIMTAKKTFCDENGFSYLNDYSIDDFTHTTGREFARMLKWAVMQGAIYAQIGNS
jgi:hypothetical protein